MSRQVNLLDFNLRPRRVRLDARVIAGTMAGIYVVALGVSFMQYRAMTPLRSELSVVAAEHGKVKAELEAAEALAKNRVADPALQAEIARLEPLAAKQKEVLAVLSSGGFEGVDATEGFATVMAALARRRLEGVWLTRVAVETADRQLQLSGRMLRADLLPRYIGLLRTDAAMRGQTFNGAHVARVATPILPSTSDQGDADAAAPVEFVEFTLGPARDGAGSGR